MTDRELAWLAGLLEGEGSFFLHRTRPSNATRDYYYPVIVLTMTDRDVVEHAAAVMGCRSGVMSLIPSKRSASKLIQYRAVLRGRAAVALMRELAPLMGARRSAKIGELLAYDAERPDADDARRAWSRDAVARRARDSKGRLV